MSSYRKKPVVVQAFKFLHDPMPDWFMDAVTSGVVTINSYGCGGNYDAPESCTIWTLEGTTGAIPGEYIIQGIQGEIYPCKEDIFLATYEAVSD